MAKDGQRVTEKYMNDNISMMELAMLTRSNGGGGLYEVEEFENNDAWGVQHGTVMANFASHVLFGTELLAPGSDGIPGVRLANVSQLSAWTGKTVRFAELGAGSLPLKACIEAGLAGGAEYFLIEQDDSYGRDPFDCLRDSRDHLIELGYGDWF